MVIWVSACSTKQEAIALFFLVRSWLFYRIETPCFVSCYFVSSSFGCFLESHVSSVSQVYFVSSSFLKFDIFFIFPSLTTNIGVRFINLTRKDYPIARNVRKRNIKLLGGL